MLTLTQTLKRPTFITATVLIGFLTLLLLSFRSFLDGEILESRTKYEQQFMLWSQDQKIPESHQLTHQQQALLLAYCAELKLNYAAIHINQVKVVEQRTTKPEISAVELLLETLRLSPTPLVYKLYQVELHIIPELSKTYRLLDQLFTMQLLSSLILILCMLLFTAIELRRFINGGMTELSSILESFMKGRRRQQIIDWQKLPMEFQPIIIPLKQLGSFINKQISDMRHRTESLKDTALRDPLTGLPNKLRLQEYYQDHIAPTEKQQSGVFALIRCAELKSINESCGYQDGDRYLNDVSDIVSSVSREHHAYLLYRVSGAEFALLLPHFSIDNAVRFAEMLHHKLAEYQNQKQLDAVAYTGLVPYRSGANISHVLAAADIALSISLTKKVNGWHVLDEAPDALQTVDKQGKQHWKQLIESVLKEQRITLKQQVIRQTDDDPLYIEILSRFQDEHGQSLPTATLIAMADKLDLVVDLDKAIICHVIRFLEQDCLSTVKYAININPKTAHNENFHQWLTTKVSKHPSVQNRLILEISEVGLLQNPRLSRKLVGILRDLDIPLTVERVGISMNWYRWLRSVRPSYIKLDVQYTRCIDTDRSNQNFTRLLVDLVHSMDIKIIAEGVETLGEFETLTDLELDGIQGYYISKPAKISTKSNTTQDTTAHQESAI